MSRYYLDTEFDGFGGDLISMALVCEDGRALYIIIKDVTVFDPWVAVNVIPHLLQVPPTISPRTVTRKQLSVMLDVYFKGDNNPIIISDWPDDIVYFCEALITGPGEMISMPGVKFEIHRVDSYPTPLADAVQHNAYWDAQALRYRLAPETFQTIVLV